MFWHPLLQFHYHLKLLHHILKLVIEQKIHWHLWAPNLWPSQIKATSKHNVLTIPNLEQQEQMSISWRPCEPTLLCRCRQQKHYCSTHNEKQDQEMSCSCDQKELYHKVISLPSNMKVSTTKEGFFCKNTKKIKIERRAKDCIKDSPWLQIKIKWSVKLCWDPGWPR